MATNNHSHYTPQPHVRHFTMGQIWFSQNVVIFFGKWVPPVTTAEVKEIFCSEQPSQCPFLKKATPRHKVLNKKNGDGFCIFKNLGR